MKPSRLHSLTLSFLAVAALAGCGGGDDTTTTAPAPSPGVSGYPASGSYGFAVKASGATSALRHGLSLAHPALPENEYIVETASQSITDTRVVMSGSVDASLATVSGIQPHSLLYIFGGDVRSVPLQADGSDPKLHVRRSETNSACRFLLGANDHAQPANSRFIVSTAGTDGVCGTADDRRAEVRLGSSGKIDYTPLSGDDMPLEASRDPATLAPRGWIYRRHIQLWGGATPSTLTLRADAEPALTQVLASTPRSALVSDGTRLSVFSFSGSTATETALDATLTAGDWQLIGFDADHYYVYDDNASNTFTTPWRVLRISKANPTAVSLASDTGFISVASMGTHVLYLTVFQSGNNLLVRLPKSGDASAISTSSFPIDTKPTVQTSAAGRHLLWLVTGVGSASVNYRIDIVDEAGALLQQWPAGAFPLSMADAGAENLDLSENRSRFLIAQGFGTRAFSNASLLSYDAATAELRTLGSFPAYGTDFVFASAAGGPGSFGVGFATRSSAGTYVEQDAQVFSYDLNAANSLHTATRR